LGRLDWGRRVRGVGRGRGGGGGGGEGGGGGKGGWSSKRERRIFAHFRREGGKSGMRKDSHLFI